MFDVYIEDINSPEDLTLEVIKSYMRIDHDLDDLELQIYLKTAIAYIKGHTSIDTFIDEVELIIPTLTLISHFYENKTTFINTNSKIDNIILNMLTMNKRNLL